MHSDTCAVIVTQLSPPTDAAVKMSVIVQISNLSNWNAEIQIFLTSNT